MSDGTRSLANAVLVIAAVLLGLVAAGSLVSAAYTMNEKAGTFDMSTGNLRYVTCGSALSPQSSSSVACQDERNANKSQATTDALLGIVLLGAGYACWRWADRVARGPTDLPPPAPPPPAPPPNPT